MNVLCIGVTTIVTTIEMCQMTAACDRQYLDLAERILQEHILLHCVPYLPLLGRL